MLYFQSKSDRFFVPKVTNKQINLKMRGERSRIVRRCYIGDRSLPERKLDNSPIPLSSRHSVAISSRSAICRCRFLISSGRNPEFVNFHPANQFIEPLFKIQSKANATHIHTRNEINGRIRNFLESFMLV